MPLSDPIGVGFVWQSAAKLLEFDQAIWARGQAVGYNPRDVPYAAPFGKGDRVQAFSFVGDGADTLFPVPIGNWQGVLGNVAGVGIISRFVADGFDPSAHAVGDPVPYLDLPTAFTLAGYSGRTSWRRDCRRTVLNQTSTADLEGNTAATGQLAYVESEDGVCLHNGTSWASFQPPGTLADKLSSTTAAPNHAVEGERKKGDLVVWELFAEIRDIIAILTTTAVGAIPQNGNGLLASGGFGSTVSWADAQALTTAAWPQTPFAYSVIPQMLATGSWDNSPEWSGQLEVGCDNWTATDGTAPGTTTLIPKTAELWVWVTAPVGTDSGAPIGEVLTFDANGYTGLADSTWWKLYTTGAGDTSGSPTTPLWPDVARQPVWGADPTQTTPYTANYVNNGFTFQAAMSVIRWAF